MSLSSVIAVLKEVIVWLNSRSCTATSDRVSAIFSIVSLPPSLGNQTPWYNKRRTHASGLTGQAVANHLGQAFPARKKCAAELRVAIGLIRSIQSINPAQGQYICDTFVLLDLILKCVRRIPRPLLPAYFVRCRRAHNGVLFRRSPSVYPVAVPGRASQAPDPSLRVRPFVPPSS